MSDSIQTGDLVVSLRGHDAGHLMFVVGNTPDGRLLLADGRSRKVGAPKRKQAKHVRFITRPTGATAQRLREGQTVTNNELRRAVASAVNETQ